MNTIRTMSIALVAPLLLLASGVLASPQASADLQDSWFFDPVVGVGYNVAQGTVVRLGLETGFHLDENFYLGAGAYYAAGENAAHDREIGGGPFAGWVYPLLQFLTVQLREEMNYVDVRIPKLAGTPETYSDHDTKYGVEAVSIAGLHISFTRNLGISGGYRLALGLTNNDIAKDRSGPYFGATIGF